MYRSQRQGNGWCYDFVGLFHCLLLDYKKHILDLQTEYYPVLLLKVHVWVSLHIIKELLQGQECKNLGSFGLNKLWQAGPA